MYSSFQPLARAVAEERAGQCCCLQCCSPVQWGARLRLAEEGRGLKALRQEVPLPLHAEDRGRLHHLVLRVAGASGLPPPGRLPVGPVAGSPNWKKCWLMAWLGRSHDPGTLPSGHSLLLLQPGRHGVVNHLQGPGTGCTRLATRATLGCVE